MLHTTRQCSTQPNTGAPVACPAVQSAGTCTSQHLAAPRPASSPGTPAALPAAHGTASKECGMEWRRWGTESRFRRQGNAGSERSPLVHVWLLHQLNRNTHRHLHPQCRTNTQAAHLGAGVNHCGEQDHIRLHPHAARIVPCRLCCLKIARAPADAQILCKKGKEGASLSLMSGTPSSNKSQLMCMRWTAATPYLHASKPA